MAYDVIIVGGGLTGATLGRSLAEHGKQVLILEREREFKDRVRGEQMHCWGVAEARRLGIYALLMRTCAREVRYVDLQLAGAPTRPLRDLVATTPHQAGSMHFEHKAMQHVLLDAAAQAGADIRRGATATPVPSNGSPAVAVRDRHGRTTMVTARLVVAADGRRSAFRNYGSFVTSSDPDRMVIAGVMLANMSAPDDRLVVRQNLAEGTEALVVPLGHNRFRAYAAYHKGWRRHTKPLSSKRAMPQFIAECVRAGVPATWFAGAEPVGPLASFDAFDTWVDHPFADGVALVGDAATASDPSFGCGLSLALRGVRLLRDQLLATDDWNAAGHAYAADQSAAAASLRRITRWLTELWFAPGAEAAARRARAFAKLAEDPSRMPDFIGLGPDAASDAPTRRRLFGEV